MFSSIKKLICILFRRRINSHNRRRLHNRDFSVLSSNCNGAFILHDLGLRFNSPFVNLYLEPSDFIKYLQRMEHYMQAEPVFIHGDKPYPIGKLEDITLHFMHYNSEQEARQKWVARTARINPDNLFVLMTDRDGCTLADLQAFDRLPFKNKVVFTHKPYPDIRSAFYIKGFEQQGQVGDLYAFSGWFGQKYYDRFDYVGWFNKAVCRCRLKCGRFGR